MPKLSARIIFACLALSTAGCEMNRPPVQAPDAAWSTYKGRVAEQCSAKHPENLPAEKLNDIEHEFYVDADTQIQQLIDSDVKKACPAGAQAECYNTGFIQASIQAGSLGDFVKQVCRKA